MWWIETTGYHLAGLIWLIVIAVIFVVAVVAISTAGAAASSARKTRRMVRDYQASQIAAGAGMTYAAGAGAARAGGPARTTGEVPPPPMAPAQRAPTSPTPVESRPQPNDAGLGDSMRILHERYARGEITREEYLRAREDMMVLSR